MELERRFTVGLECRRHNGKPRLEGLAIPYESLSEDIGFRETIASGAFSKHLRSNPDVRAYVEHDAREIIGRTQSGTLRLEEKRDGVHVSIDPPDSQRGNDLVESVRRGDLTAMSFGFRVLNDDWSTRDGESHRRVTEAELLETSVVSMPSYPETRIALRSLDRWQKASEKMETKLEVIEETPAEETEQAEQRSVPAEPIQGTATAAKPTANPLEWRDQRTGQEIRVLGKDDRFADFHRNEEPLSLGRAVRAMICGDWSGAEAEQRAMSTSANPSAGFLVSESAGGECHRPGQKPINSGEGRCSDCRYGCEHAGHCTCCHRSDDGSQSRECCLHRARRGIRPGDVDRVPHRRRGRYE